MGRSYARYHSGIVVTLGGMGRGGIGCAPEDPLWFWFCAAAPSLGRRRRARSAADRAEAPAALCAAAPAAPAGWCPPYGEEDPAAFEAMAAICARRSCMCLAAVTFGRPGTGKSHSFFFIFLKALICARRRSSCSRVNPERTRKLSFAAAARSAADAGAPGARPGARPGPGPRSVARGAGRTSPKPGFASPGVTRGIDLYRRLRVRDARRCEEGRGRGVAR